MCHRFLNQAIYKKMILLKSHAVLDPILNTKYEVSKILSDRSKTLSEIYCVRLYVRLTYKVVF